MLVIEGSDLVGKTSLIKALCDEAIKRDFPMIPQHFGLLPDSWQFMQDYLPYINASTVMDRFILSELVYGSVLRENSRICLTDWNTLQGVMKAFGCLTVIVAAEPAYFRKHVESQYAQRNEVFEVDQICAVNRAFLNIVDRLGAHGAYDVSYQCAHIVTSPSTFPSTDRDFVELIINKYLALQGT